MFESEDVCAGYAVEMEVFKKYSPQESRNYLKFRGNPISIDTTKSDIPFVPPPWLALWRSLPLDYRG